MDRIDFLGFVLLLRDISRLDRYSTQQSKQIYKKENCGFSQEGNSAAVPRSISGPLLFVTPLFLLEIRVCDRYRRQPQE